MAEHTPAPLRIVGPSSGNGTYDDGGDYGLVSKADDIVFEAFFRIKHTKYAPAKENARRLAAMWQACEGISTEDLEAGAVAALVEAAIRAQEFIVESHNTQVNERAFRVVDDLLKALAPFEAAGN